MPRRRVLRAVPPDPNVFTPEVLAQLEEQLAKQPPQPRVHIQKARLAELRTVRLRLVCAAIYAMWLAPLLTLANSPSATTLILAAPSLVLVVVCALPIADWLRLGVYRDGSRVVEDVNTRAAGSWTWRVLCIGLRLVDMKGEDMAGLTLLILPQKKNIRLTRF